MNLNATASWPEIIWSACSAIGLSIMLWALLDAICDARFLIARDMKGCTRWIVAKSNIVDEAIGCVVQAAMLSGGVIAMLLPPGPATTPIHPIGAVIPLVLTLGEVLLVVGAFQRRHVRIVLYRQRLTHPAPPGDRNRSQQDAP